MSKAIKHPAYPSLFKSSITKYVEEPCMVDGEKAWQQCYICGVSIQFNKHIGKWLCIGDGLIRHKDCEPLPYVKGVL